MSAYDLRGAISLEVKEIREDTCAYPKRTMSKLHFLDRQQYEWGL